MTGESKNSGNIEGECQSPTQQTLYYEQVQRLEKVVCCPLEVVGNGNYPNLRMTVRELMIAVRKRLESDGMAVRDIRINGSAANHIVAGGDEEDTQPYNDLDLIFRLDQSVCSEPSSDYDLDQIKDSALMALLDFLDPHVSRDRLGPNALSEAYVHKMVKVGPQRGGSHVSDRWSLITLCNPNGPDIEMKFVISMKRQYEFSIDSFQVVVDSFLQFCEIKPNNMDSETGFYPTVFIESAYGDYEAAMKHTRNRLIAMKSPEEVRGGGLLKYCFLLARKYKPAPEWNYRTAEPYMCSRFFIDFPEIEKQEKQFENYLLNHFSISAVRDLKLTWLTQVRTVVSRASQCVPANRRQNTIQLIEALAARLKWEAMGARHCIVRPPHPQRHDRHHFTDVRHPWTSRFDRQRHQKQVEQSQTKDGVVAVREVVIEVLGRVTPTSDDSALERDVDESSVTSSSSSDVELDRLSSRSTSISDLSNAVAEANDVPTSSEQTVYVSHPPVCFTYLPFPPGTRPHYMIPYVYTTGPPSTHFPVVCGPTYTSPWITSYTN
jgi:hypothetical protein